MNNESSPLLLPSLEDTRQHENGSQNNDMDCKTSTTRNPIKKTERQEFSLDQTEQGIEQHGNPESQSHQGLLHINANVNVKESFDDESNVEIKLVYHTEVDDNETHTNQKNNQQATNVDSENNQQRQEPKEQHHSETKVTYLSLVQSNKPLQLFLSSYIITQMGEWFTYVASIELMEQILGPNKVTSSRRYISYLVVFRLLPFLFISPFGGVLADVRDRRKSMIVLDWIGAIAPLLFLIGAYFQSIPIIYLVTAIQSTIAALYEPCRNSIIPLLAPGEEEMQKATILAGLVWSVMAAFGAATGGFMVSIVGIRACFGKF